MNGSWHTYEWIMSHIWMSHVTHMNESCRTYEWVMLHIWMRHVTHMSESCHTCVPWPIHLAMNMGWLRLVGSLKLYVSFAKDPYKRDDILQQRPIIWRSLLIVATLYHELATTYHELVMDYWSWHTYEYVMAHRWTRHGTLMHESWYTDEWVMEEKWIGHGTHEYVMAHR